MTITTILLPMLAAIYRRWGTVWSFAHRRRVPVVLQFTPLECGAACMAMILGFYGRKTRVAECRDALGIGRDGVTALQLVEAARRYELHARAVAVPAVAFGDLPLPVVAHWKFNHFVVVERWSPAAVHIVDPSSGRSRLTLEEFASSFSGVALCFTPGADFSRRQPDRRPAWVPYLKSIWQVPHGRQVASQVIAASLCLQLLGLALPFFTKLLVDNVIPFRVTDVLTVALLAMMVTVLTQIVVSHLRVVLLLYLRAHLDADLQTSLFAHLVAAPLGFLQLRSSGDLIMRLGSTVVIRELLTTNILGLLLDAVLVLGYLAVVFASDHLFGLLVLGCCALELVVLVVTAGWAHELTQRDLVVQAEARGYFAEAIQGMATLKAVGGEDHALKQWKSLVSAQLKTSLTRAYATTIVETAATALQRAAPLVLLWMGTVRVLDGSLSVGAMLALQGLSMAVLTPLSSLVSGGQQLQMVGASLERVQDIFDVEPEQNRQDVGPPPRLTGRIDLEHVSFRYTPTSPYVLRDVSVAIKPGQKIALVGPTGSGKSTLALTLLGLLMPTEGEIAYDGIPLTTVDYRDVRRQFGVVLQGALLFSGSIRQNIALYNPELSFDQVVAAAGLAGIHDEIARMPMGYETRVGEGGVGLSGGQRQRIALARALASEPAILLLDEATSHLDAATEALVVRNIRSLSCTQVVIAHRLSTVRDADLILVMDRGEIVERGSHDALLARHGAYARLVSSQLENDLYKTSLRVTSTQPSTVNRTPTPIPRTSGRVSRF